MNTLRAVVCVALPALGAGCVSSSGVADAARVRELSGQTPALAAVEGAVEPATHDDVRKLLQEPLTTEAAVRIALLNNRELRARLRQMGVARGHLMQAAVLPNPVVEAEMLPERETQLELRLEYDLTSTLLAPLRADAARPELDAARFDAAGAVVAIGAQVRKACFVLQAKSEQLGLAKTVLDAYAAALEGAEALVASGNAAPLEQASRSAAYQRARVVVAQLELEAMSARESLQRLLGLFGDEAGWELDSRPPPLPAQVLLPEDLEKRVIEANLELRAAQHRLDGLARRAGVERTAGYLPDVALDVHALQQHPDAAPLVDDKSWRWGGGVSVGVPLFDRRQGNTLALEAEFDAEMERYIGRAVDLRSAARELRFRMSAAHDRATHYRDVLVPAHKRLVEQMLLQLNAMQVSVFALLQARRDQLDVDMGYVEARRDYLVANAEMDALLAGASIGSDALPSSPAFSNDATQGGH